MPAGNSTARPYNRKEKKAIKDSRDIKKAYKKIYNSEKLDKAAKERLSEEVRNSKKNKNTTRTLNEREMKEFRREIGQKTGSTRNVKFLKMERKEKKK